MLHVGRQFLDQIKYLVLKKILDWAGSRNDLCQKNGEYGRAYILKSSGRSTDNDDDDAPRLSLFNIIDIIRQRHRLMSATTSGLSSRGGRARGPVARWVPWYPRSPSRSDVGSRSMSAMADKDP